MAVAHIGSDTLTGIRTSPCWTRLATAPSPPTNAAGAPSASASTSSRPHYAVSPQPTSEESQLQALHSAACRTPAHGSLLCQDAAGSGVLGLGVTGPGSGLSEELVWGCEPVALETESLPGCPPGSVLSVFARSSTMTR